MKVPKYVLTYSNYTQSLAIVSIASHMARQIYMSVVSELISGVHMCTYIHRKRLMYISTYVHVHTYIHT